MITNLADFAPADLAVAAKLLSRLASYEQGFKLPSPWPKDFELVDVKLYVDQYDIGFTNSDFQQCILRDDELVSIYTLPHCRITATFGELLALYDTLTIEDIDALYHIALHLGCPELLPLR